MFRSCVHTAALTSTWFLQVPHMYRHVPKPQSKCSLPPTVRLTLVLLTGCSFLLNPFSCCSAASLCNTTGGCSRGQYWCHLTEACVPASSPCSTYNVATESRRFAPLPRYNAMPPYYHLVADLPFQIEPSPEFQTLNVSCMLLNIIRDSDQTPLKKSN